MSSFNLMNNKTLFNWREAIIHKSQLGAADISKAGDAIIRIGERKDSNKITILLNSWESFKRIPGADPVLFLKEHGLDLLSDEDPPDSK